MLPDRGKPFRFFDLPRELRDEIYDLLPSRINQIKKTAENRTYSLWREGLPLTHLLLVNKQFSNEHSARASKKDSIRLKDDEAWKPRSFQLPAHTTSAATVVCSVTCVQRAHSGDLEAHIQMVESLVEQMSGLQSLQVQICFEYPRQGRAQSTEELLQIHSNFLGRLEKQASLSLLELHMREYLNPDAEEQHSKMVASYTKTDGWKICGGAKGGDQE